MKAMLLAAGLGTRLRPLTEVYAKPAVPLLNIPLLYYSFALLQTAGELSELVVNTHHKPEQIERLAGAIPGFSGPVRVSPEPGQPLGSGGGVWKARQWLNDGGDFLLANADEVIIPSSPDVMARLRQSHRDHGALATLLVMRHAEVGSKFGAVWTGQDGRVHGFGKARPEGVPHAATPLHYIGVLMLSARVFSYLPEGESNLLYDALMAGIRKGETVQVHEDACIWFETGNIPDLLEATRHLLKAPAGSLEADFVRSMARRFRGGRGDSKLNVTGETQAPCLIGERVSAEGPVEIKGFAVIGDGCRIGRGCRIENAVLLPGATLADGQNLAGTIRA